MEVPGDCKKLHNEGLHHLANISAIRSRRMKRDVVDMREIRNAWKILVLW
jgi:hypothetical protein